MVGVMMIGFIVMNNYVYFDYLEFNEHGTSRSLITKVYFFIIRKHRIRHIGASEKEKERRA